MAASIDVRALIPDWDGPLPLAVRFTRNRTVLVSCAPHPRGEHPREVRLHELFRSAPREAQVAAIATVLRHVSRAELFLLRKRFRSYVHAHDSRLRELSHPSAFARRAPGPRGDHHDLDEILRRLVATGVARPHDGPLLLTWTAAIQRRILGTYEKPSAGTPAIIRINRLLDDPRVPEPVVGYVIHHELLHGEMPSTVLNGRRRIHPPGFRKRERQFPGWRDAERWEKENVARLYRSRRLRAAAERRRAASLRGERVVTCSPARPRQPEPVSWPPRQRPVSPRPPAQLFLPFAGDPGHASS